MVGRSGAGASRRMAPKRTRGVSRSSGAVPARGDDVAVDSPVRGEEPLVHRCKQMSAVVAASVAVACVSVGYSLWQAAASQSAGRPGNKGFLRRLGRFSRCEGGRDARCGFVRGA